MTLGGLVLPSFSERGVLGDKPSKPTTLSRKSWCHLGKAGQEDTAETAHHRGSTTQTRFETTDGTTGTKLTAARGGSAPPPSCCLGGLGTAKHSRPSRSKELAQSTGWSLCPRFLFFWRGHRDVAAELMGNLGVYGFPGHASGRSGRTGGPITTREDRSCPGSPRRLSPLDKWLPFPRLPARSSYPSAAAESVVDPRINSCGIEGYRSSHRNGENYEEPMIATCGCDSLQPPWAPQKPRRPGVRHMRRAC
ncbi:hypothetical protein MAPG_08310 [Magnaporthiopsis poae ATCC 64411]|uniref:Uncharacterized protein n=1 Tax=Magnaporthiopsis poae (strain ATCC 64411 / 73-15) TaxID=644358 RepID=A0A0C4E711_MAGP6|nr:hypothetical protein MAPG_08310 [Magnaporthiopsis poae ATCC 64411]